VAVVGSGPSGLAVADQLNHRGHLVTVFEREDQIGGLLMYGIPEHEAGQEGHLRRQKLMEAEGVVFRTGVDVGVDVTAEELKKEYDAVVLCCGAKQPRPLRSTDLIR
jgi:glutamate synthase (NADPH/NADH) small chain